MTDETKNKILEHANKEFPRESCGLILNLNGKEIYKPCKNLAESQNDFILDPLDFAEAEDSDCDILSIVHSHCNISPKPSQTDLVACESSGLPWHIVSVPRGAWHYLQPSGYKAPLIGRSYSHGVLDCYSLIVDWYREELNINIPDFDRSEKWWEKGQDLYMDHFDEAGFYEVDDLKFGDVILMQIASKVINHGAVYIGRSMILHHLINRLSTREIYGGYYKKVTRKVVRYKQA